MKPLKTYACYLKNEEIRMNSSSGAVFSALAFYVFENQGIVYGVAMSEDCYSAEFISVTDEAGLKRLRGSKYLQAKMGDTYKKVKADIIAGRMVLFSGTGCQINGLKNYLNVGNVDIRKLICVDVICHGVPSPRLWGKYAQYHEKKNGGKLKMIHFRCKDGGWMKFGIRVSVVNAYGNEVKKRYISKDKDSYMQMFLRDYCLRPSCYECAAKDIKMSDITIADFWGIDDIVPKVNDNKGISLVLIRTEKGQLIFDEVSREMWIQDVSYEDGIKYNPAEYRSAERPVQRDVFFEDMQSMSFEKLEKKYIVLPINKKVRRKLKNILMSILRICRGGKICNSEYGLLFVIKNSKFL